MGLASPLKFWIALNTSDLEMSIGIVFNMKQVEVSMRVYDRLSLITNKTRETSAWRTCLQHQRTLTNHLRS